jgi:hypothetical protein
MIQRYVNTASTAGGDGTTNATSGANRAYATLSEAFEPLHFGSTSDVYRVNCSGATADPGTSASSSTDHTAWEFTTSPTNYVEVIGDNTTGMWNTSAYRIEVTNRHAVYNQYAAHVRFYNLQVQITNTNGSTYDALRLSTANNDTSNGAPYLLFKNCIVRRGSGSSSGATAAFVNSVSGDGSLAGPCYVINCLAIGATGGGSGGFNTDNSAWAQANIRHYNCTAAGCLYSFNDPGIVINCLSTAPTSGVGFVGTYGTGSNYNAEDDGNGAPGANSRTAQTFTFVNAAGGNYQLATADAGAKGFGVTDPGSGLYLDDITGTTRTVPWDIGAWKAQGVASLVARNRSVVQVVNRASNF